MSEDKIKVFDLANELGIRSLELVEKLNELGIAVKSHMSSISLSEADLARSKLKKADKKQNPGKKTNWQQPDNKKQY